MAATSQLDKIAELIDALEPLGRKQRGMRLEADEWNRLVAVLGEILEIDKTQETTTRLLLEGSFAVKDHEHLGQVQVAWLDPTLQERVSEGGGSLSVRSRLADVAKRVDTGAAEVARLTAVADQQQQRNDRASVEELERSAKLRGFEERFTGLEDLRALVAAIEAKVAGLDPAIDEVLKLREQLTDPTGKPIDVSALVREVEALVKLCQNFNGVDGKPVRMRDVEIRLKQIEDVLGLVGSGGLEGRFAALSAELSDRLDLRVDERVGAARAELAAERDEADGRLRAEVDGKLAASGTALGQAADAKVAAAEARIGAAVAGGLRDTGDALRAELTALVTARVTAGLAGVPGQIDAAVGASEQRLTALVGTRVDDARKALETMLADQVPAQVSDAVGAALQGLDQRIDARLGARLDDLLHAVDDRVRALVDQRLADVPAQVAELVDKRLDAADLPGQFKELGNRLREELRGETAELRQQIARLDERLRRLGG